MTSYDLPAYKIEHFYWGKHIQDKEPVGEYRIIATSKGWRLEDANTAFYKRIYGGSHNGVTLNALTIQISIASVSTQRRSDFLLAFIERSQYITRTSHYPVYHVMRLPITLVEAYNYQIDLLIDALYQHHRQQPDPIYSHLLQEIDPLILPAANLPQDKPATWQSLQFLLSQPFAQPEANRVLLLNQLLNGGKIVITHAPTDVLLRVRCIIGLMQWFPAFARQRIQGGTALFKSADSPLNIQFLFSEVESSPVEGALVINWETGAVKMPPPPPDHPYTNLAITSLGTLPTLYASLEQIEHNTQETRTPTADTLYQIAWRYAYDNNHLPHEAQQAEALKQLIHMPLHPDDVRQDLLALFQLALKNNQATWLAGMHEPLKKFETAIHEFLGTVSPLKQVVTFLHHLNESTTVRVAQWLYKRMLDDDKLVVALIKHDTSLAVKMLQDALRYRKYEGIEMAVRLLNIASMTRKDSLAELSAGILQGVASYQEGDLDELLIFFEAPLRFDDQITLLELFAKAQYPLDILLTHVMPLLLQSPDIGQNAFTMLLESASDASCHRIWAIIQPHPTTAIESTQHQAQNDISTAHIKSIKADTVGHANPEEQDDTQQDPHNLHHQETPPTPEIVLNDTLYVIFLRHLLYRPRFTIQASQALLTLKESLWQPTLDEAVMVLQATQQTAKRDAFYRRMIQMVMAEQGDLSRCAIALQTLSEHYNKARLSDESRFWQTISGGRNADQFLWQLQQSNEFLRQAYETGMIEFDRVPIISQPTRANLLEAIVQLRDVLHSFNRNRLFSGKSEVAERILMTLDRLGEELDQPDPELDIPDTD